MRTAPKSFHAEKWIDGIYDSPLKDRESVGEDLINEVSKTKRGASLVDALIDKKEFIKLQYIPYIYYVPLSKTLDGRVFHFKFSSPVIAKKHRKLPLILGVSYDLFEQKSVVPIDYVENYEPDLKQILSYAKTLSKMTKEEKNHLVDLVFAGVQSYREGSEKRKGWLSDYLKNSPEFELVGFALNHTYINVESKYGDTQPLWVHPWGTPVLLYVHRDEPFFILTGPALRLDENVRGEKNMVGFTG